MRSIFTFTFILLSFCAIAQTNHTSVFYFEFDSEKLTPSSQQQFERLIQSLGQKPPQKIIIKGHTDKAGADNYNQILSSKRASALQQLFQQYLPHEVSFVIEFYGEQLPATTDDDHQQINRRAEVFFEYPQIEQPETILEPYREDVETQVFKINLDDTIVVKAKAGTFIKIPPGSIQDKGGVIRTGEALLTIKEYYQPSDILLSGLHSSSSEGLLQTGGMLHFAILQKGDTMSRETKKNIEIRMPQINKELNNMNVFALDTPNDSAQWQNTAITFTQISGGWTWPYDSSLMRSYYDDHILYSNMRVGHSFSEEYETSTPFYNFILRNKFDWYFSKRIKNTVTKLTVDSIKIASHIKYRNRGYRALGKRQLDTTFIITYSKSTYQGFIRNMNWINCDRFYRYKNKIDFAVNTPGFIGISVMAYFKKLSAFMPAVAASKGYQVQAVPPGMEVVLVAIGKKGNDFYYGTQQITTEKGLTANVKVEKVTKEDMINAIRNLQR